MIITDKTTIDGIYKFTFIDAKTKKITYEFEKHNLLVQNFKNGVFNALTGTACDIEITDIATGTGTTSAAVSDTSLETELYRNTITSINVSASQLTAKLLLGAPDSNFNIKEIGVFAGAKMLSRTNVNIDKNSSTQLLITYTLTIN